MKTSKELADELDAQDRLMARGYRKKECPQCEGTGMRTIPSTITPPIVTSCCSCDGKGWTWEAPMTR